MVPFSKTLLWKKSTFVRTLINCVYLGTSETIKEKILLFMLPIERSSRKSIKLLMEVGVG
jgi:hypothetical protein